MPYYRQNGNPVSFDSQGNLADQVTGQKGTMMLPEVTVRGISPETRARNYSSAYRPSDALEFFDIMTRPITAPTIPSTQVGAIRNALNGGSYFKSLMGLESNLGITTENFNKEHPYLSAGTNFAFDMLFPLGLGKANKGINTASTFIGKKYVTPYMASKMLDRAVSANPKGQILVSDSYFNSPNNWYRISNTPEIHGIKEVGKNVTTRDSGVLIDVPSDNWRTSILDQPLIRDKEGFLTLDPQRPNGIFDANEINWSPRLFQKSGSAHGNRTQAAKGQIWKGGLSNSSMFPTVVIEGEAAQQVPIGFKGSRTNFKLTPWEDIPMGHRIGFKTGEMPIENLSYFERLNTGKYSYKGQIIPDKRINMPSSDVEPTSSRPNNFTDRVSLKFFERPTSKLTELERAGVPKADRNQPLNTHLKGDKAVQMFKEYGGIEIPSNSINGEQLAKYVQEARLRYGLVGNTNISDREIAESLYKRSLELGKGSGAINAQGEPQLLFRADTRRYNQLKQRLSPEELSKGGGTMDNSLGNLFLGELPATQGIERQGIDRYLGTVRDFRGTKRLVNSGTGSSVITPQGEEIIPYINDEIANIPEGSYLLASYNTKYGLNNIYKLPQSYMKSGVNDINAFIVKTPKVRDATREISVLSDDALVVNGPKVDYYGPTRKLIQDENGFPLLQDENGKVVGDALAGGSDRSAVGQHYREVLNRAQQENQGLLKSSKNSFLRDEHEGYTYFALPNFNIKNAKHLLSWDLRKPIDWNNSNIFKKNGGKLIK